MTIESVIKTIHATITVIKKDINNNKDSLQIDIKGNFD